jgi:hypothetical protein
MFHVRITMAAGGYDLPPFLFAAAGTAGIRECVIQEFKSIVYAVMMTVADPFRRGSTTTL